MFSGVKTSREELVLKLNEALVDDRLEGKSSKEPLVISMLILNIVPVIVYNKVNDLKLTNKTKTLHCLLSECLNV